MPRKTAEGYDGPPSGAWLLTFSDMVTLLLTFFVLIIAITTVDPKSLADEGDEAIDERVLIEIYGNGLLSFSNPNLMKPVTELFEHMEELPPGAVLNQEEIKNAIFQLSPDPSVPGSFQEQEREVRDSVSVFKDERGMVLRWDEALLFPEGSALLREDNLVLLGRLAEFLSRLSLPVSVESHTNPLSELEGGIGPYSYELSKERSRVVMDYLTGLGLKQSRFRLGAFGGSRPLSLDPSGSRVNSRLEIVLYKAHQSSWKG
ncbi:MAG: OmpA family protein [Deltaproteobacteria bacterium]|jgi:chemotaxis protein MotB|nr:OmpA family protein [Deltaproteobacteria bacterium]